MGEFRGLEVPEMAESSTRAWTRWQDYAQVVLGAVAALSTIWVDTSTKAMWAMIVLGVLIALDGLVSLAAPNLMTSEGAELVLGVLLFISPWVLGYTAMHTASWLSWVIGALTVVVGGLTLQLQLARRSRGGQPSGQH
jgi:uncharacterized membrane protein HdeD (DUF308 family)